MNSYKFTVILLTLHLTEDVMHVDFKYPFFNLDIENSVIHTLWINVYEYD